MSVKADVSVIIAFYNGIEWLKMIFVALGRQSFKNFEVIVADDGSREEVVKELDKLIAAQPFRITHLWQEDLGFRKNMILNRAVEQSRGEYLLFLDGDCIPHRKLVEEHYKVRKEGTVIAGRRVELPATISDSLTAEMVASPHFERKVFLPLIYAGIVHREQFTENSIRITSPALRRWLLPRCSGYILGCNFSMYKSDLLKANGFDERYVNPGTGEDTDLEFRLARMGITPVVMNHYATVYHKKHRRLDVRSEANRLLFEENNKNCIGRTPYGIVKEHAVSQSTKDLPLHSSYGRHERESSTV